MACFAHSQLVVKDGLAALTSSTVLSKCSALATLVHHHTPLFKSSFEEVFGSGHSVPVANSTRWNSLLHQLEAAAGFDSDKMTTLLQQTDHSNLILSSRELSMLLELIDILQPFAEATDKTQGNSARISCVLPTVVALHKCLSGMSVKFHTTLVRQLLSSLERRFKGLLATMKMLPPHVSNTSECYASLIFPISTVLDPQFGFQWLDLHHPGSDAVKNEVRRSITGI